jgi:hypothetical protein
MYDAEEAVEKLPDKEPSTSKQACVQETEVEEEDNPQVMEEQDLNEEVMAGDGRAEELSR